MLHTAEKRKYIVCMEAWHDSSRLLQENKTHLQRVNLYVFFLEKIALQNSFMKHEFVLYINDPRNSEVIITVFKLHDLADLYTFCNQNITQLGLTENKVHKTKLKEQLLAHVPDLNSN